MSKFGDIVKSFSPGNIAKKAASGIIGELKDGAVSIVKDVNDKKISLDEGLRRIEQLEIEKQISLEENITDRWEADANSDSWLSKNIRPLTLGWVITNVTLLVWFDSGDGFDVNEKWIPLLTQISLTVIGGYFALRSFVDKKKSNPNGETKEGRTERTSRLKNSLRKIKNAVGGNRVGEAGNT